MSLVVHREDLLLQLRQDWPRLLPEQILAGRFVSQLLFVGLLELSQVMGVYPVTG
jgi:hypothetical protein